MITASLELSKRLKEAGYPQDESTFYWAKGSRNIEWTCVFDGHCEKALTNNAGYGDPPTYSLSDIDGGNEYSNDDEVTEMFAAPTAEEILEKLPEELESSGDYFFLNCHKDGQWLVSYYSMLQNYTCYINDRRVEVNNESLVNACALMYLHIKEHNLL